METQSLQSIAAEISGEIAFRNTVRISQFDRIQANSGWHEAARLDQGRARWKRWVMENAVIEGWPSNGSSRYSRLQNSDRLAGRAGELWMLEPRRERLCSYEEIIPLTLVKRSGSGRVEPKLVDVGSGIGDDAYKGQDITGKIVLPRRKRPGYARGLPKRGPWASLPTSPRCSTRLPHMIRYTAFWPRWEERNNLGFGFNVSKNQGASLKRMLEEGQKVVLKPTWRLNFSRLRSKRYRSHSGAPIDPNGRSSLSGISAIPRRALTTTGAAVRGCWDRPGPQAAGGFGNSPGAAPDHPLSLDSGILRDRALHQGPP